MRLSGMTMAHCCPWNRTLKGKFMGAPSSMVGAERSSRPTDLSMEPVMCRVPSDSEQGISESKMAIGRRENLPGGRDGQTESMERREALPDRERGAEPKGARGTNR